LTICTQRSTSNVEIDESRAPTIERKAPESAGSRPLMANGNRYARYSRALRDLARPRLLDNRVSYRLLEVDWTEGRESLGFNYTSYFDLRHREPVRPDRA
jgi:hypothetical protein